MSVIDRIAARLAGLPAGVPPYRCRDCGVTHRAVHEKCPECGGEIETVDEIPGALYWDPFA